ncbi:DUF4129 domain-containing protein [Micromonospora avicenniae]|uniref:Protein-glutamine gamma-glutamyltransferase-like C-terminal domain-containing protein n=1 Tax=Micromonospora avicenniae TaxID=1198245 RepID=A0A1N7APN4_9ACTN|nr:DUF4129 domain-containing protein [Micromonospora avicenniae]SIR41024.1 protein of unknown function [Micromonospora avicenniae]
MSFSRWWTETTAALGDHVPLSLVAALLVVAGVTAALGWYTFPAWVPRRLPRPRLRLPRIGLPRIRLPRPRWPRLRRPRLRLRRRRAAGNATPAAEPAGPPDETLDQFTAHLSLADRLAAEGRYAEAVRERLRDMIRELAARQVVPTQPGLTVLEVGSTATRNRPHTGPPVVAAGLIFSELWYAQRPATADHDRRMRELAAELHRVLATPPPVESAPADPGAIAAGADGSAGPGGGVVPANLAAERSASDDRPAVLREERP